MRSRRAVLDAEQLALAVGDDDEDGGDGGRGGSDRGGGAEYSAGGGFGKKGKKKGGGGGRAGYAEPGPPVDGASLRVDSWPQEVDAGGALLGPVRPGGCRGGAALARAGAACPWGGGRGPPPRVCPHLAEPMPRPRRNPASLPPRLPALRRSTAPAPPTSRSPSPARTPPRLSRPPSSGV